MAVKLSESTFRNFIGDDGPFKAEEDRYHLYIAYTCPWATRTLILRDLKGLQDLISVTVLSPRTSPDGWTFAGGEYDFPGAEADPIYHAKNLKELYLKANPDFTGRFTVPVLWDKKLHTIVNNESSEIIRILNSAFNHLLPEDKAAVDLYPTVLRAEIDSINKWIYEDLNVGVYKAGFTMSQEHYEAAVIKVFEALDRIEATLSQKGTDFLVGNVLTEADIRLWVTVIRFDPVYFGLFKCNIRDIRNGYPAINVWMKRLYWTNPTFKRVTHFDHIKTGYYWSRVQGNPTRIVPVDPHQTSNHYETQQVYKDYNY